MRLTPLVNHWWNVPLYVSARGLTTSRIPYGQRAFELWFDFVRHQLVIETTRWNTEDTPARASLSGRVLRGIHGNASLRGDEVKIWRMPVEIPNPIPFDQDRMHRSYDPAAVERFWRILLSVDAVFSQFRSGFIGKCSPVHFFWGVLTLRSRGFRAAELRSDPARTR